MRLSVERSFRDHGWEPEEKFLYSVLVKGPAIDVPLPALALREEECLPVRGNPDVHR